MTSCPTPPYHSNTTLSTGPKKREYYNAHLKNATLAETWLHNTTIEMAHLEGTGFQKAMVDGGTAIWRCYVDRHTDFNGVGLGNARIDPATKQLLDYNLRRMNWEQWCAKHRVLRRPVWLFWSVSDYGLRTWRIIATFFMLALIFAALYYLAAILSPPGVVNNLLQSNEGVVPGWLVPVRAFYFSVVTMTTLGFGDMHANCQSLCGHVLLTLQVLLGYVLLGALVTRFAVLFTAGGPAGRFAESTAKGENQKIA